MKRIKWLGASVLVMGVMAWVWFAPPAQWAGVDEAVVARIAREARRPPGGPIIKTEKGDLPLFLFLLAGCVGGFVAGYAFRHLFPPRRAPARPGTDRREVSS